MHHSLPHKLNELYVKYNRPEFIAPDPLQFVAARRDNPRDCEIVGLLASSLAFGSVAQINRSVALVLDALPEPRRCIIETPPRRLALAFAAFRHRYADGRNLADLIEGIRHALDRFGSIEACFTAGLRDEDETVLPALDRFVACLREGFDGRNNYLLAAPIDGSACKRMHLYLRWMVRRDSVDPGPWRGVTASRLIVPLDTHLHRVARRLGFTDRRQANGRTALEITTAFRRIAPDDPVKYDFALTRPGIRKEIQVDPFWARVFEPKG